MSHTWRRRKHLHPLNTEDVNMLSQENEGNVEADVAESIDLNDPALYLNRELTWLAFNRRVLHEAEDARNPLLERLKFLAIVSGNLDEFFMKRIGGLKQQVGAGMSKKTATSPSRKAARIPTNRKPPMKEKLRPLFTA
jgi:polyphosphate kinase